MYPQTIPNELGIVFLWQKKWKGGGIRQELPEEVVKFKYICAKMVNHS